MISGSLWLSGARAITNLLAFLSTIVLARLLAPADFGIVALGTTIMVMITAVTEMSLSQALVHHPDPTDDHFHTVWTLGAARAVLLAGLMAAAAYPAAWFYHEPRLAPVVLALAASVVMGGLANPRMVTFTRQLIFWQTFMLSVAGRLSVVLVSVAVAIVWKSYWALIAGSMAGQVVSTLLSYTVAPYRPRVVWRHARELWSFSIWLTLGQAINTINWRFDQLLVGNILGRTALGHYSVGDNLAQMPTREATYPLRQTLFPALARIADDPARLRAAYQRAQGLVTLCALPIGIGFALVADPVVRLAMGEKWAPAIPVIQALSSVFALQTIGDLVQPLGMSKGRTRLLFQRDLQMFFIRLPVIIAGTMIFGLPGLIYSRVATGLGGIVMNMTVVRRITGLSLGAQMQVNTRSLAAAAAMVAATLAFQHAWPIHGDAMRVVAGIAGSMVVAAIAYIGTAALLWRLSGRPDGAEAEVLRLAGQARARLGARFSRGATDA